LDQQVQEVTKVLRDQQAHQDHRPMLD
jgi:hypothetical protein